ncbi:acyltransferase [uncultured Desulfobulbus sp.]|uniref:acyltransferase n=1 Tax=uncultured Desulfobulbus sp. TaxID=239745 RepID=UPI0029C6F1EF|nr:acyltransferase [uncultured Desulfobulbus sp.]
MSNQQQGPQRHYDISSEYSEESAFEKYIRLTVGENASLFSLLWHELLLSFCLYLPGITGLIIRKLLYTLCFPHFNFKSYVGRQVTLRCPRQISLGEGVIIDDEVHLIATSRHPQAISIGKNSFLRSHAMVNAGPPEGHVTIGQRTSIGQNTILYGNGGLLIGNDVMIGGNCFIVASSHVYEQSDKPMNQQGFTAKGIRIGNNVWIGAGVTILDGVTIGDNVIIGANSVVNHTIKANSKVAGSPARLIQSDEQL